MSLPPIDLDAREVLEHLRNLGYEHITKDQLKLFIKDLKRLIKHDLRKVQALQNDQENLVFTSNKKSALNSECAPPKRVLCERNRAEQPYDDTKSKSIAVQTFIQDPQGSVDAASSTSDSTKLNENAVFTIQQSGNSTKCSCCKNGSCPCVGSKVTKKLSSKKENSSKPVSSFIRVVPSEAKSSKNDPVTLYHYYQTIWARQNRPGENPHADVRWRIRHKMMAPTALKIGPETKRENPPWVE